MITTINKYPFFDLLEVIPDSDLNYKTYQKLKPVKSGNLIPDIDLITDHRRWKSFSNGSLTHGQSSLKHLFGKPLAIAFYSRHWNDNGISQLLQLDSIQNEIKASGGNLLILTDEAGDEELTKIAWENSLSLNFYHDIDNELAKKFRVYSEEDPAWNRFSGIDVNIPLLAIYVIDTNRHIVYDHIDTTLEAKFIPRDLIEAVYGAALSGQHSHRKSA
jgi:peroxiredoxin